MGLVFEGIDGDDIGSPLVFTLSRTNLNCLEQMTKLLDSMIDEEEPN